MRKLLLICRCLAIAFVLAVAQPASAAFILLPSPTPETPGVSLTANTAGALSGTVLAALDSSFVDNALPTPFASGTLRTFVVDRGGGLLDFVYQLVNTSAAPPDLTTEFFRIKTTGGFNSSLVLSVAQTNAFAGLIAGSGSGFVAGSYTQGALLEDAATADRDVGTLGSIGFDFPTQPPLPFIGDPRNVGQGESSTFLIVRTDATQFGTVRVAISGAATGFADSFAPAAVPEPSSFAIFAIGLGIYFLRPRMSRRLQPC